MIFIWHCQDSNSQPVSSQACTDSSRQEFQRGAIEFWLDNMSENLTFKQSMVQDFVYEIFKGRVVSPQLLPLPTSLVGICSVFNSILHYFTQLFFFLSSAQARVTLHYITLHFWSDFNEYFQIFQQVVRSVFEVISLLPQLLDEEVRLLCRRVRFQYVLLGFEHLYVWFILDKIFTSRSHCNKTFIDKSSGDFTTS